LLLFTLIIDCFAIACWDSNINVDPLDISIDNGD
jgi:hypothetical protein